MIARLFLHISVKTNIEFGIFIYFYIISIFLKPDDKAIIITYIDAKYEDINESL